MAPPSACMPGAPPVTESPLTKMSPPLTCIVADVPLPVSVPVFCPTMLICGVVGRGHVSVPFTDPRITSSRIPAGTDVLGRLPLVEVTTMVSALEAQRPSWWLMQTPGPMAEHSLSAVQARQAFVVVLQIGVAPEHVVLSVHCTQAPVLEHAGRAESTAEHWEAVVQPVHVFVAPEQMGVAPEQLALVRHWTHLLVEVSQTGVAPEQVELSVHRTQAPVVAQAGLVGSAALHWAAVAHAAQVSVATLQIGAVPEQLALVRHCTHLLVAVSQTGVAPEQVELSVHWTQAPAAEQAGWAGSAEAHWLAEVQAEQTCVVALQIGVAPEQLALVRHWTQVLVVVSQTGAGPEQAELSAHCTHAPTAEHAGRVASIAAHWAAVVQAAHTPPAAQTGEVVGQEALVRQPTQAPPAEQRVLAGSFRAAH
jgi:hypothetical protein